LATDATAPTDRGGKAAEGAGEPEDLPWKAAACCDGKADRQPRHKGQRNWVQPFERYSLKGLFLLPLPAVKQSD